ncbi:MAG: hypothetical protein ACRC8S_10805 [Fimbriiglobus sp.]
MKASPSVIDSSTVVPPVSPEVIGDASPPVADKLPTKAEWFQALDIILAGGAVVLAFLMASFIARNSDLWLHLANGRALTDGQIHLLGVDALSFAAPDRPWVHSTWLFDIIAYVLYMMDQSGGMLVGGKAILFASTFGLFWWLRKPGDSLWPWAMIGVLGILAAATQTQLRSTVVSMFFLSATLVLIHRMDWSATSWKPTLKLAGLMALWANFDHWFILGPLVLICLFIGSYINRFLGASASDGTLFGQEKPAARLPQILGICVAACLLNPFFLTAVVRDPGEAVMQLVPLELGLTAPLGMDQDVDFRYLTLSPLSTDYQSQTTLGLNIGGGSYAALLAVGLLILLLNYARLRGEHIALWLAFAGLSLVSVRLIPFCAIVLVPILASHMNGFSASLGKSANEARDRTLITLSGVGRFLSLMLLLVLLVSTYPGWLHPQMPKSSSSSQNRLDWGLAIEPGYERTAKILEKMNSDGRLPESARGMTNSVEFGNYMAWFAPKLKTFVNARFTYHRHEIPDLLKVRVLLPNRRLDPEKAKESNIEALRVLEERNPEYLILTTRNLGREPQLLMVFDMLDNKAQWTLWSVDGRAIIMGKRGDAAWNKICDENRYDTAKATFASGQQKLPETKARPPYPLPVELAEEFIYRPRAIPTGADDATMWKYFADDAKGVGEAKYRSEFPKLLEAHGGLIGPFLPGLFMSKPELLKAREVEDEQLTTPIQMIRAARQAIHENPNSPEPYSMLAQAYEMPFAPVINVPNFLNIAERELQLITIRNQLLDRMPKPAQADVINALNGYDICERLVFLYQQTNQLDGAKRTSDLMMEYFNRLPEAVQGKFVEEKMGQRGAGKKPEELLKQFRAQIDNMQDRMRRDVQKIEDQVARNPDALQQFQLCAQNGLPMKAREIFQGITNSGKSPPPQLLILKIVLDIKAGKVEDASASLESLEDEINKLLTQNPNDQMAQTFRGLQAVVARLEGNPGLVLQLARKQPFEKMTWDPKYNDTIRVVVGLQGLAGGTMAVLLTDQAPATKAPLFSYLGKIDMMKQSLIFESLDAHERAMQCLLDGSVEDAKQWLRIAARPQNVPLETLENSPRVFVIERYLSLLQRAGVK